MDSKKREIEKIYSRNNIKLPKFKYVFSKESMGDGGNKKVQKCIKIVAVLLVAAMSANVMLRAILPIVDTQCINIARNIATQISNEQATVVMSSYKYEDLVRTTKDADGNIKMISSDMITINKIISDIPIRIQNELEKEENNRFYIRLGSFTGSKLLAGRGPKVEIKITVVGNIETDLKSEFSEAGINQTLHRVYLEIKCNVTILTPFNNIEEHIVNQVLLAEGIIVGNTPSTYYNLDGMNKDNLVDIVE